MPEAPYTNREINAKFDHLKEVNLLHFKAIQTSLESLHKKADFTNGKIRKVVLAVVALAFLVIGALSGHDMSEIMSLIKILV